MATVNTSDQDRVASLVAALKNADMEVRNKAAHTLIDLADPKGVESLVEARCKDVNIYAKLAFVICKRFDTFSESDKRRLFEVLEKLADDTGARANIVQGSIVFNICAFYDKFTQFRDRCEAIIHQLVEQNNPFVLRRTIDGLRHHYPTVAQASGRQLAIHLLEQFTAGNYAEIWDALPFAVIDHHRELPGTLVDRIFEQATAQGRAERDSNDITTFINAVIENYNSLPMDRIKEVLEYFSRTGVDSAIRKALGEILATNYVYFDNRDGRREFARRTIEKLLKYPSDLAVQYAIAKSLYFHHGTPYEERVGIPMDIELWTKVVMPYFQRHKQEWINLQSVETAIDEAIERKTKLQIVYYTAHRNAETIREILPQERYSNPTQGAPWFRGFDYFRNEDRKFKLNRIREIK